jgi:phosphatidylglycerol:prolipoprotein diacylglycerol transferase
MFHESYDPSNYQGISFPGVGLEVNPDRVLQIGSFSIHYYGLIIAIGLALAVIYGLRRRKTFGLTEDHILDGALLIVPFAIICARLYYCAFSWDSFKDDPISMLYIWNGGLAIYGGVIGAALGIIVYCKVRKISLGATLDLVALGFLIGQAIGRWGNFMNREAFGAPVSENYFLAMGLFNRYLGEYQYFHPTFLYESLWNVVGFVALHFLSKKRQYDGQIALGYVAWYGLGRAIVEGLRTDSLWWGPFRVSQLLAAVSCIVAVAVLLVQAFRVHDRESLFANKVAAKAAAEAEAAEAKEAEVVAQESAEEPTEETPAEEPTEE